MTMTDTQRLLIDLPMPIETPRLRIRPVMPGDGAALHEAKCETFDMLHRWMPWAQEIGTPQEDEATVRKAYARFILREDFMAVGIEKETGRFVVFSGLHRFDWTLRRFEIGYWVRKTAQGKGYATECANALTRYAFGALGAQSVVIYIATDNVSSQAIPPKLGFEEDGVLRCDMALPTGEITDKHVWSCLSPECLPPLDVSWGEARAQC